MFKIPGFSRITKGVGEAVRPSLLHTEPIKPLLSSDTIGTFRSNQASPDGFTRIGKLIEELNQDDPLEAFISKIMKLFEDPAVQEDIKILGKQGEKMSSIPAIREFQEALLAFDKPLSPKHFAVIKKLYKNMSTEERDVMKKLTTAYRDLGVYNDNPEAYDLTMKMLDGAEFTPEQYETVRKAGGQFMKTVQNLLKGGELNEEAFETIIPKLLELAKPIFELSENEIKTLIKMGIKINDTIIFHFV